ncbi:MAG: alpha/beta hydrolase family protein, partial [Hyphococcus sp.]
MTTLRRTLCAIGVGALAATTIACAQQSDNANAGLQTIAGLPRAVDRPLEQINGVTSHYGMVETSDGARLRTIITIPENAETRPHPLLFTQWVSCSSIEFRSDQNILARLAQRSGLALLRVERASNGDSIGPACDELDYDTEVRHYIEAYTALLGDERINRDKVYVYGSSLGSTTAPLVAKALQDGGYDIAGVAIQGGGAETYYERMLTFDRLYLERRPDAVPPENIHDELIARAKFHYEYLINDRHPDDIATDSERMATVRGDILGMGEANHYGRPFAWHQQAAKQNFLGAWAAIDAPVLVIFNEFDQFEM